MAESEYTFSPNGNSLALGIDGFVGADYGHADLSLFDQTASTELYANVWDATGPISFSQVFAVDPGHDYLLTMCASVYDGGAGGPEASVFFDVGIEVDEIVAVVPAPGALLLGGVGIGMFGWLRRRGIA